MTLDELKQEAAKYGYKLYKNYPYIALKDCPKCVRRSIRMTYTNDGRYYRCRHCQFHGEPVKNDRQARIAWNNAVDQYNENFKTIFEQLSGGNK